MKEKILIKASAGSGKTYRLMELLSEKIAAGTKPQSLLATTFTVKAAAELQSRIRQELLKGPHPELASQVFDGLIGTVNSVCGQLLSEYAIESGLSPALDVLPEENADAIFAAATHTVFEKYAETLEPVAARLNLNPLKENTYGTNQDWRKDVRQIVNFVRSNAIDKKQLQECAEKSCIELAHVFQQHTSQSLEDIVKMLLPFQNFEAKGQATIKTVKKIQDFLRFPTWSKVAQLATCTYAVNKDKEFQPAYNKLQNLGNSILCNKELFADMTAMIRGVFACAADSLEAYANYKKEFGLVDFVDQESKILELLNNNENFRKLLEQRIDRIMVDEFQDTNPIQLALFQKLHECAKNGSVWVGDPKQAIYGFRGTDPELMESVAATASNSSTLKYSWRSKENLVNFSNEIFKKAFSGMLKESEIVLEIPEERKNDAKGGLIEAWHMTGNNKETRFAELASGIAELIRKHNIAPGDICVLFRNNDECSELADALAKWNISASAPAGDLLETAECQLVMAAYRYCIDNSDTVALATLTALYGENTHWLNEFYQAKQKHLSLSETEQKNRDPFVGIKEAAWLKKLVKPADATPLEILEHVIAALDLDSKIAAMDNPELRMSNLDELRKVCNGYMNMALVNRCAATPSGFAAMLYGTPQESASGFGQNTVNIMTYHKSKGLEFPIVILGSLNSTDKASAFGVRVLAAETFDRDEPLKGRSINYWPWPFGSLKNIPGLQEILSGNPLHQKAKEFELEENKRLFYVGLTRAKNRIIFAIHKKSSAADDPPASDGLQIKWLEKLYQGKLFTFPTAAGVEEIKTGDKEFTLITQQLSVPENIIPLPSPPIYAPEVTDQEIVFSPAKANPSSEKSKGIAVPLAAWNISIGKINCPKGKFNLLGSAFHDYFALHPQANQKAYAQRLLENYGMENAIDPDVLVTCCGNLYNWISQNYPNAKISCEVPATYRRKPENQTVGETLYQGFIDMLLELPEGFVIIDHKTHPTEHDAQTYAAECFGQLELYQNAITAATGKEVLRTIIHFPNLGKCYEVKAC